MARDLEDFLRKAAERRRQKAEQGQRSPPPARPAQQKPTQRPLQTTRQLPRQVTVDDSEIEVIRGTRESVEEHVRRHIDTRDVTEHASRLAEEVGLADEKLQGRIQRTFDHDLGQFKRQVGQVADAGSVASRILQMLRSPESVRNAIVVAEILKRPDFDNF